MSGWLHGVCAALYEAEIKCPSCALAGTRYCWMSTGLYIPGRQVIEVSLPEEAASADLKVRPLPISPPDAESKCSCYPSWHCMGSA